MFDDSFVFCFAIFVVFWKFVVCSHRHIWMPSARLQQPQTQKKTERLIIRSSFQIQLVALASNAYRWWLPLRERKNKTWRTYFAQIWTLNVQSQTFCGFRANTIFAKSFNRIMQYMPPTIPAAADPKSAQNTAAQNMGAAQNTAVGITICYTYQA